MAEKRLSKSKNLIDGYHPAVLCVWAAIQAASNMFPVIALVGVGGTMSMANVLVPLTGIFFGPYAGGLCAAIGQFIGMLINPSNAWLGVFTFLIDTCKAFVAGLLFRGMWKSAYALNLLGIVIYNLFPVSRIAWIKTVTFGITGIVTCLFGGIFTKHFNQHKNPIIKTLCVFLCSAGGLITACMFADLCTLYLYKTPAISIKLMAITAPVERLSFAAIATVIGVPLLYCLPKIGIHVGPKVKDEFADEALPDTTEEAATPAE